MIHHESKYLDFISQQGVGAKDIVASSPASYVSYLNSVSRLLDSDITPAILRTEGNVREIAKRIAGKRSESTIRNYCSAMRQYAAMVRANDL